MERRSHPGGASFTSRAELEETTTNLTEIRRYHAELEAMRNGDHPIPESIAEVLRVGELTIDEFVEICQSAAEDVAGKSAATLAAVMRDMKDGRGTTDYVEMIKRMAAQRRELPEVE